METDHLITLSTAGIALLGGLVAVVANIYVGTLPRLLDEAQNAAARSRAREEQADRLRDSGDPLDLEFEAVLRQEARALDEASRLVERQYSRRRQPSLLGVTPHLVISAAFALFFIACAIAEFLRVRVLDPGVFIYMSGAMTFIGLSAFALDWGSTIRRDAVALRAGRRPPPARDSGRPGR